MKDFKEIFSNNILYESKEYQEKIIHATVGYFVCDLQQKFDDKLKHKMPYEMYYDIWTLIYEVQSKWFNGNE